MISKKEKLDTPKKYVLSEETLSLSATDFEIYIKNSKAKPDSIKRYYREYDRYYKEKIKEKEEILLEIPANISVNEYRQKEVGRNISRQVILTGIDCNILLGRKRNQIKFNLMKRLFKQLMIYKKLATAITLKVKFNDVINGVTYTTDIYVSTTLFTINAFNEAFFELKFKLKNILNKYPDREILVKRCITKFYYKREIDKNE